MVDIEQFIEACGNGDVEEVNRLLNSRTPFFFFKRFLQARFINTVHNGKTALCDAAGRRDSNMVRLLLEKGADVELRDESGGTALFRTVTLKFDGDSAKLLLDHGADINTRIPSGFTPLHMATKCGLADGVQFLLRNGAAMDLADGHGRTAISYALELGDRNVVEAFAHTNNAHDVTDNNAPCLHCQKERRITPKTLFDPCEHCGAEFGQATSADSGFDLREHWASVRKAKEADQERLSAAIDLYRRNADLEEWAELNLDRDEWLLKFKYMGLDDIFARAADRDQD